MNELQPFTVEHFRAYASLMVFEDGECHPPEDWQLAFAEDTFAARERSECALLVPEGNGKSTFIAQLGLYGLDYAAEPWIPIGASARDQAEIIYSQAEGFIRRTKELRPRFRAYGGYRKVQSLRNGGKGLKVYPHDPKTGDGVIPYPYALIDEPHRHPDMRLVGLWRGKLRKRGGKLLMISTAGEPGTEFEELRDRMRVSVGGKGRQGPYLRGTRDGLVFHEFMVQSDEGCGDMEEVKKANPLGQITPQQLLEDFESATLNLNDWKRFKCNRPARGETAAITDQEWDDNEVTEEPPEGCDMDLGFDVGWKWDTTALVGLVNRGGWHPTREGSTPVGYRLLAPIRVLVPPRDGSTLHPDVIKNTLLELHGYYTLHTLVMDTSRAEDIAHWAEDELGIEVVDRAQGNALAVEDYDAFMKGLRNGTVRHNGDKELRRHSMNAIARRLPGGAYRFDRPATNRNAAQFQDTRVIDALTAAGMVVQYSDTAEPPAQSVYEQRFS